MITTTILLKKEFWTTLVLAFSITIKVQSFNNASIFTVIASASSSTICLGDSVNLSATTYGATGALSYSWTSNGSGVISTAQNPKVTPTVTTIYTVTVTDDMGTPNNPADDLVTTDTVTVTVNALPITPILSTNSPICSGENAVFTITGTPGNVVTYSGAANGTATIGAGGTVNVILPGVTANTTLIFTNVANTTCNIQFIVSGTVTVNPLVVPTFYNYIICSGSSSSLPTISNNGVTGTWSPSFNNTSTTTYTFTPNPGQCAASTTAIVMVTPAPSLPVVPNVCTNGSTGTITVVSPLGASFAYSLNGGPFQSSPIFSGVALGTHTIMAQNIATGCLSAGTAATVILSPNAGINASINVCNENIVSAAELLAALGKTANIGGNWNVTPTGAGTYTYTVTNDLTGCSDTAQVNVSFNESVNCIPDVDVIIKIEAPNVIYPGQTVKIIVYYSATTPRDIKLFLELMAGAKSASVKSSAAAYVLENTTTVQAGRGSYEVTFTIPNLADSIDAYRWGSYMTTQGGDASGMIGSMNLQEGVDVDSTLGTTKNELNTTFSIYPNPAQTALNVNVTEVGTLSILDLNGKVLMKTDIKTIGNTTLNIEALNSGVYFCRYTNTKGFNTMKLVKM